MGKNRTMSICVSDIPKDKIFKHENGKMYLAVATYDLQEPDRYGNDFSVSIQLSKEEVADKKAGKEVKRVFIGNGKIWPDTDAMQPISEKDEDDLPF